MPAIGSHSTATTDRPWDGPGARARMRNNETASYYRYFFAWMEAGADNKSGFKFPHHNPGPGGDTGTPANTRACSAIIAILNGGRGRANIPSGDRSGVHRHAGRHLRDAGKEVPPLLSSDDYEHACNLNDGEWIDFIEATFPGFGRWAEQTINDRFANVVFAA